MDKMTSFDSFKGGLLKVFFLSFLAASCLFVSLFVLSTC